MIAVAGRLSGAESEERWILAEPWQLLAALRRAKPRPLRHLEEAIAAAVMPRIQATADAAGRPPGSPSAEFQAQLLGRIAVAALRTAAIYHREQAGEGDDSPGIERLLADAFAHLTELTRMPIWPG
jgi:hypothetical protein